MFEKCEKAMFFHDNLVLVAFVDLYKTGNGQREMGEDMGQQS